MGFWKYAEEDPGYLAIVDPDGTEHAAGDVLARANQVVHALRALGIERGDAVAAVLPNGSHPMHVYLAALQAGFYYVPINYRLSAPEIAYIIQDSDAKAFDQPRALRRGRGGRRRRGRHPRRERASRTARSGFPRRSTTRSTRSRRRCPTTAPPARRCTTRRARPASPRA